MNVILSYIALGITNPRIMLMENIRQSCIYYTHVKDLEQYWDYMETFSKICADIDKPVFTEECAIDVINYLGLDRKEIDKCMKQEIESIG